MEGIDFAVVEAEGALDTGRSSEVQDLKVAILVPHKAAPAICRHIEGRKLRLPV